MKLGQVPFPLSGNQFRQQPLESVHGLHPTVGQFVAAVGQHSQGLELPIGSELAQAGSAQRDHRDGVRVERVGLAVVAGVEEPDPSGQLRRDVNNPLAGTSTTRSPVATSRLAGLDESLGQRAARAVGSLHGPDALRPRLHVAAGGATSASPSDPR